MANTKNRKLPDPKFKAGDAVTVWHGWHPERRTTVVTTNKRGIKIEGAQADVMFDVEGWSRRTSHRLVLTNRRIEAEALLSGIMRVPRCAPHWERFTLEQLEAAVELLCLWPH